jgi:hypothetical protein
MCVKMHPTFILVPKKYPSVFIFINWPVPNTATSGYGT